MVSERGGSGDGGVSESVGGRNESGGSESGGTWSSEVDGWQWFVRVCVVVLVVVLLCWWSCCCVGGRVVVLVVVLLCWWSCCCVGGRVVVLVLLHCYSCMIADTVVAVTTPEDSGREADGRKW